MDFAHLQPASVPPVGTAQAWWLAVRPKTLSLSIVPVVVGLSLAWWELGSLTWLPALAAALAALLIQAGTNLHNDAADYERGADAADRAGPRRAAASGWISAKTIRHGAYASFGAAFTLGVYLAWVGGWPIVALGLSSLAAGLGYTGGRRPIAYTATGELFAFLFFGVAAVAGTYYLQTLRLSPEALIAGGAVGMFAAAVLVVNNYRDLDTDLRANKRTLASVLGRGGTRVLYALLILLPFPAALLLSPQDGQNALWLTWLALPLGLDLARRFYSTPPGPAFNRILARTAQLQAAYGVLMSLALLAQR